MYDAVKNAFKEIYVRLQTFDDVFQYDDDRDSPSIFITHPTYKTVFKISYFQGTNSCDGPFQGLSVYYLDGPDNLNIYVTLRIDGCFKHEQPADADLVNTLISHYEKYKSNLRNLP